MDGARADEATAPRGRLAILLAIAIALPVLIVVLGSRTGQPSVFEAAGASPTQVVTQASAAPTTTEAPTTTSTEAPATSADASTTAWTPAATTPTTSWSSSTAASRSTSAPTTAKAAPTTTRPVAKAAPVTTAAPATAPPTTAKPAPAPAPSQSAAAFLACVRQRESGGNYSINTGNGYYGAYQFYPSTWDQAARLAGRPDLVGRLPHLASPADQDAVALALYLAVGPSPWGGVCY